MNYFFSSITHSIHPNDSWGAQQILSVVNYAEKTLSFGKRNVYVISIQKNSRGSLQASAQIHPPLPTTAQSFFRTFLKTICFALVFFPTLIIKISHRCILKAFLMWWHQPDLNILFQSPPPVPLNSTVAIERYETCRTAEELLRLALQKTLDQCPAPNLNLHIWKLAILDLLMTVTKKTKENECDDFYYLDWGHVKVKDALSCEVFLNDQQCKIFSIDIFSSKDVPCTPVAVWEKISAMPDNFKSTLRLFLEGNSAASSMIDPSQAAEFTTTYATISEMLTTLAQATEKKYQHRFKVQNHKVEICPISSETKTASEFKNCRNLFEVMKVAFEETLKIAHQNDPNFDEEDLSEDLSFFYKSMCFYVLSKASINQESSTLSFSPYCSYTFKNWANKVCFDNNQTSLIHIALHEVNDFTSRSLGDPLRITDEPFQLAFILKGLSEQQLTNCLNCLNAKKPFPEDIPIEVRILLGELAPFVEKRFYGEIIAQRRQERQPLPPQKREEKISRSLTTNPLRRGNTIGYSQLTHDVQKYYIEISNENTNGSCVLYAILQETCPNLKMDPSHHITNLRTTISDYIEQRIDHFLDYVTVSSSPLPQEWAVSAEDTPEAKRQAIRKRCEIFRDNVFTYVMEPEFIALSHHYKRPLHIITQAQPVYTVDRNGKPQPDIYFGDEYSPTKPILLFKKGDHITLLKEKPLSLITKIRQLIFRV